MKIDIENEGEDENVAEEQNTNIQKEIEEKQKI